METKRKKLTKMGRNKEIKRWDVFYNLYTKHPSITWDFKNNKVKHFNVSHKNDKNHRYKMYKNLNPNDRTQIYMDKRLYISNKRVIGDKYYNYKVSNEDKKYIENLKK